MQKLRDVVIVAACRTPIGAFGGSLKDVKSHVLAATVMKEVIARSGVDPKAIGDIRFGCCMPDLDAINVARVGALTAGIPSSVPAVTINRVCVSGMEAVHSAVNQIAVGFHDVILAGGVESMSNQPYVLPTVRWGQRLQDGPCLDRMMNNLMAGSQFVPYPLDGPNEKYRGRPYIMGLTAEFLAQKHNISREDQDIVAVRSHNNVERATKEGRFKEEIVGVEVKVKKTKKMIVDDEHFRPGMTIEAMSKLSPTFIPKTGTVTAGNASGINDGASALMLMARETAESMGLKPLAVISGMGHGGCPAEYMGESPVPAVRDMMKKTGRSVADYDRVEVNEAFAAQYIAVERQLGLNREVTNVNGSGIGMGHPVGSSGSRVLVTLLHELIHSQKKVGMASLCGGGGVSLATEITLC